MLPAVAGSASLSLLTSLPAKVQLKMASGSSRFSRLPPLKCHLADFAPRKHHFLGGFPHICDQLVEDNGMGLPGLHGENGTRPEPGFEDVWLAEYEVVSCPTLVDSQL